MLPYTSVCVLLSLSAHARNSIPVVPGKRHYSCVVLYTALDIRALFQESSEEVVFLLKIDTMQFIKQDFNLPLIWNFGHHKVNIDFPAVGDCGAKSTKDNHFLFSFTCQKDVRGLYKYHILRNCCRSQVARQ